MILSQYEIDGPSLYQDRPVTKVTGYIFEVHLRGLHPLNVIPTAAEGSRLSSSPRRGGVELLLLNRAKLFPLLH
jgi:hypothetical protein